MGYNTNIYSTLLFVATLCVLLPQASAFGAGDIPDFAYLNDKAFRHGDIENILENLAKTAGKASIGGSGLLGIAVSVVKAVGGPSKFSKSDIKKVYFGNWLRDYSQAMDIAGLTKLTADTLILIVSVLGFMTFGFTTEEFAVTADRLGVYLPVEHIDNPKGYAEKEGDARKYHPKLRPPVDPRELEIDLNTGMKKYMATENQGWDTSTAFIRRTLKSCIEHGRRANGQENADLWEAYRLLGTGLHTLEDLLAHSNWCELALRKMGHNEVFCHVGDRVIINTPNGPAPPLVTGTFGGADFLHSLLGEAGDKLSQASVTDLASKMSEAQNSNGPDLGKLKSILSKIMGGSGDDKLDQGEQMQQQAQAYNFDPNNACPPEVKQKLVDLLKWHDDVMRQILRRINMVPGLADMLEEFTNALNAYIYTILAPYVTPLLTQATQVLSEGSKAVIDNDDQYQVFDNPNASDPSHSLLSKDHFGLILNEPAGKIAQLVVEHTVTLIVESWSNNDNTDQVLDQILEAFHHPYYSTGRSQIQHKMYNEMGKWLGGLGPDDERKVLAALTKEAVREHKNKRLGSEDQNWDEAGYAGCGHGHAGFPSGGKTSGSGSGGKTQTSSGGYGQPSYGAEAGKYSKPGRQESSSSYGGREESNTYGSQASYGSSGGRQSNTYSGGGRQEESRPSGGYGGRQEESRPSGGYAGGRQENTYGSSGGGYGGRQEESRPSGGYGGRQDDSRPSGGYGGRQEESRPSGYGGRQEESRPSAGYGGRQETTSNSGYGRQEPQAAYGSSAGGYTPTYGGRRDDESKPSYGAGGYGGKKKEDDDDKPSYGGGYGGKKKKDDDDDDKPSYGGGYGSRKQKDDDDDDKPSYGGGYGGKKKKDDDDDGKPSYGGGYASGGKRDDNKPSYGAGGGYGRKDDDDDKPKYSYGGGGGGHSRDESDDKPKYSYGGGGHKRDDSDASDKPKYSYGGGGHKRDDSDDKPKYGGGGGSGGYAPSYGGGGYQGGQSQGGYAPSYGRQETFGAERMKLNDSDDEDKKKKYRY